MSQRILIVTKEDQQEIMEQVARDFSTSFYIVTVLTDPFTLFSELEKNTKNDIRLIMLDIRLFQLDLFNPWTYMKSLETPVPVIFYNDPYPNPETRADYWITKNKNYLEGFTKPDNLGKNVFDGLYESLYYLQMILSKKDYQEKIYGLRLPEKETILPAMTSINAEDFDTYNNMKPEERKVFCYLLENEGKTVQMEDICLYIWKEKSKSAKNSLYVCIHNLRQHLSKEKKYNVTLNHEYKNGYRLKAEKSI